MTCSAQGEIQGFFNLCSHRAAELCSRLGIYSVQNLVCPYHSWVYGLDGQLVGAPMQAHFSGEFKLLDYPLQLVRIEVWAGFLFACFAEQGPTLEARIVHQQQLITGRLGKARG